VLGRIPYAIRDLHAKYGPIVRTAPDELAFVSSLALKDIYTRHGVSKKLLPKDPITYQIPPGGVPCILTALDDDEHTRIRRLVWHAFSEKALQEQSPLIKRYVDLLIFRLKENAAKEEQDLVRWYTFTAFDIIGDLTLGEGFQCLEKSDYHPWVGFLFRAFKMSGFISGAARFPLIGQYLLMLLPKSIVKARMEHAAFTREKVLKRMQLGTERSDFMSNILKNNEEGVSICSLVNYKDQETN
jgi:cytochrome P450